LAFSIAEITNYLYELNIDYQYYGSTDLLINCFCPLFEPKQNAITWVKNIDGFDFSSIEYFSNMLFVTGYFDKGSLNSNCNVIQCNDPKETYFEILKRYFVVPKEPKIESDSIIETEIIGKSVSIGHHCYICKDVIIGDNVTIKNNVIIECPTQIGNNTIIWSGVIIGTDGYGYFQKNDGINHKVPHFGGVRIGKNVEIGANTCIDRGTLADTVIGNNVKIDNLCFIAHNVNIEDNVMMTGSIVLGGSCVIRENVYIAPGAVVLNQITVGKDAFVTVGAVVMKDVHENAVVYGNPGRVLRNNKGDNENKF
jgi:UDP-3-O-[3-hydroxymyristoyl] glucosamine N-acyltransferase